LSPEDLPLTEEDKEKEAAGGRVEGRAISKIRNAEALLPRMLAKD